MPARGLLSTPREYLTRGQWPDGVFLKNAPIEARRVAEIASQLKAAIGERSLRSIATEANVSIGTLSNLLGGRTWGDVVTLVRLEEALGVQLWCGVHDSQRHGQAAKPTRTGRSRTQSGRSDLTKTTRKAR